MSGEATNQTRWRDVVAGDRVELKGSEWTVVKAKHKKGKPSRVTVTRPGRSDFTSDVDPKGRVTRLGAEPARQNGDDVTSEAGEIDMTAARMDRAQKVVEKTLDAKHVASSSDGGKTWSVPAVDVTTVAAHLHIMHGVDVSGLAEASMLEFHQNQHASGAAQAHPHTHEGEKK